MKETALALLFVSALCIIFCSTSIGQALQPTEIIKDLEKNNPFWTLLPPKHNDNAKRFTTHISVDKPIYKPGDTLHWRAILLDALTNSPKKNYNSRPTVEITSAKGDKFNIFNFKYD
jgi:hypothetical protein